MEPGFHPARTSLFSETNDGAREPTRRSSDKHITSIILKMLYAFIDGFCPSTAPYKPLSLVSNALPALTRRQNVSVATHTHTHIHHLGMQSVSNHEECRINPRTTNPHAGRDYCPKGQEAETSPQLPKRECSLPKRVGRGSRGRHYRRARAN